MPFDRQDVFDRVATHLLTQRAKAQIVITSGNSPVCRYRDDENRRCAVGCLIADEDYEREMEGAVIARFSRVEKAVSKTLGLSHLESEDVFFLRELQRIHDENEPSEWRETLDEFARSRRLEWRIS